jgi:prevent-host-death family protein
MRDVMEPINILDARNRLSQLIAAAGQGEEVVIAKRGRPIVRIVPVEHDGHKASDAALWLTTNHAPSQRRTSRDLDEQITREREGWE